jgi:YhcH/YjgK/YiaL family protein
MAVFGTLTTVRSQTAHLPWLQPAFDYLDELFTPGTEANQTLRSLAAGEMFRRELAGGNFALEQVYLTKPRAQGVYETHRKYVDVQVIFEGEEFMEVTDPGGLTVRDAYNPERDAMFYHDARHGSVLRLRAGDAAIYLPKDAHMGGLQVAGPQLVRKAVVKVPMPGA